MVIPSSESPTFVHQYYSRPVGWPLSTGVVCGLRTYTATDSNPQQFKIHHGHPWIVICMREKWWRALIANMITYLSVWYFTQKEDLFQVSDFTREPLYTSHNYRQKLCISPSPRFNNRVVDAWNSLSNNVVLSPSVAIFKKRLCAVNLDWFMTIL